MRTSLMHHRYFTACIIYCIHFFVLRWPEYPEEAVSAGKVNFSSQLQNIVVWLLVHGQDTLLAEAYDYILIY